MNGPTAAGDDVTSFSYLCIGCPLGCRLELDENDRGEIVEIRGSSCRRGDRHATQEHTDPRRLVTTTVPVSGGSWSRLPVRTTEPIPKALVREAVRTVGAAGVTAPVRIGDVIVENLLDTGIDVIATRDMAAAPTPAVGTIGSREGRPTDPR